MALSEPQGQLRWTHRLSTGSDGLFRTTRTTQMDSQTKHRGQMALSKPQEQLRWTHRLSTGSDGVFRTTRTTQMDSQTKHRVR